MGSVDEVDKCFTFLFFPFLSSPFLPFLPFLPSFPSFPSSLSFLSFLLGAVVTVREHKCFLTREKRVVYFNMPSITVPSQMWYSYGNNILTPMGLVFWGIKRGMRYYISVFGSTIRRTLVIPIEFPRPPPMVKIHRNVILTLGWAV